MTDRRQYVRAVLGCLTPAQLRTGLRELWNRPATQVPALDALRSLAVLLVVAHHWWIRVYRESGGPEVQWPSIRENPVVWLFGKLSEQGWTGVASSSSSPAS